MKLYGEKMNRQFSLKKIFRQFIAISLLTSIGAGALSAQTKGNTAAKQPAKTITPTAVKAGWSGVITYRKTLDDSFTSDEKLFGRLDESERIKHNNIRKYSYEGRLVVNDFAGTGRATTSTQISLTDSESQKTIQTELTNCHSWEPDRLIKAESTDRKTTVGTGGGEAYSYSLSVNGGRFSLDFTFPEIQGRYTHETSSTYSNLCPDSQRQPSASSNNNDVRIERGGASVEGEIDPKNPDVLEGSKTWSSGATTNSKGFTHTVTWKLRRKPQPLMITNIRFYQPIYPSPNDWQEIPDTAFAVDGNQVKIVATVANLGATDKMATVNFKELKENTALPDGAVTATIPANSQKDVELIWDTSGYAWRQSGADVVPETNRQIEAKIPDDTMQKDLTVIPKPVVIVWGIWQSGDAMAKFRDYFKAVNEKWALADGMTDVKSVSTDNADALDNTIRKLQKKMNAWHVDLAATQSGGLTARVYVNSKMPTMFDGRPAATHLILTGVPNLGTPCATGIYGLSFKINTLNLDAVGELSPDSMKRFNLLVNNTNGTKFATLAVRLRNSTCQEEVPGDGLTPVQSAIWRAKVNTVVDVRVNGRNFMGEVAVFRQVYKWLAVPPKGDHEPDPSTLAARFSDEYLNDPQEANFGKTRRYGAMFNMAGSSDDGSDPRPDFAKVVSIPAKKMTEIEIPIRSGSRFSLNLFASPDISATLIDDKGEVVGTNLADSPEAAEIFRTITVKKPFQAGKWKLRLENRAAQETEIGVAAFVDYVQTQY
jgi:hypothetical protein